MWHTGSGKLRVGDSLLAETLQCEQFDQQHREIVHKDILAINKNVSEQS